MSSDGSSGVISFSPSRPLLWSDRSARQASCGFRELPHSGLKVTVLGGVVSGRSGGGEVFGRFPRGFPWWKPLWEPTLAYSLGGCHKGAGDFPRRLDHR